MPELRTGGKRPLKSVGAAFQRRKARDEVEPVIREIIDRTMAVFTRKGAAAEIARGLGRSSRRAVP